MGKIGRSNDPKNIEGSITGQIIQGASDTKTFEISIKIFINVLEPTLVRDLDCAFMRTRSGADIPG
jgi:hypothetical protein